MSSTTCHVTLPCGVSNESAEDETDGEQLEKIKEVEEVYHINESKILHIMSLKITFNQPS